MAADDRPHPEGAIGLTPPANETEGGGVGLAIAIAIAIQIQIQIAIAIQIVETPRRRHLGAVDTRRIATFVVIVALADA